MRQSWNAAGVGSTVKLSPAKILAPADTRNRMNGRRRESFAAGGKNRLRSPLEFVLVETRSARHSTLRGATVQVAKC